MAKPTLQERYYRPGRMAIIYHNSESKFNRVTFQPDDPRLPPEGLQFPHLEDAQITLLVKKGILVEAVQEQKKIPDEEKKN